MTTTATEQKYLEAVKIELHELQKLGIGYGSRMSEEVRQAVFDAANSPMKVSECADMVIHLQTIAR